jgi:hypothetical protein
MLGTTTPQTGYYVVRSDDKYSVHRLVAKQIRCHSQGHYGLTSTHRIWQGHDSRLSKAMNKFSSPLGLGVDEAVADIRIVVSVAVDQPPARIFDGLRH